jgi:hypothetical protein
MRKLILVATILAMTGTVPAWSRSGHGHGHHHSMHSRHAPSAPANPSVQSANTPSPDKQKMDPEDAALDKRIKSICRGC